MSKAEAIKALVKIAKTTPMTNDECALAIIKTQRKRPHLFAVDICREWVKKGIISEDRINAICCAVSRHRRKIQGRGGQKPVTRTRAATN